MRNETSTEYVEAIQNNIPKGGKNVCYARIDDAMAVKPPPASALFLLPDKTSRDMSQDIDRERWVFIEIHECNDRFYDENIIREHGQAFFTDFAHAPSRQWASEIQQMMFNLPEDIRHIVVSCEQGKSKSEAVAVWIAQTFDFELRQPGRDANPTIIRLLNNDASLCRSLRQTQTGAIKDSQAVDERPKWEQWLAFLGFK